MQVRVTVLPSVLELATIFVLKVWKGGLELTFRLPAESKGSPCQGAKPKALTYHQGFLFELHIRSEAFAAHGRRAPTLLGPESQLL